MPFVITVILALHFLIILFFVKFFIDQYRLMKKEEIEDIELKRIFRDMGKHDGK